MTIRSVRYVAPLLTAALLASCSDSTGPSGGVLEEEAISLEQLGQHVGTPAAARVHITMREDGVVAQRVVVKTGDELSEPEGLAGAVTGISVEGDQGTLTLRLGLEITFDAETDFSDREGAGMGFDGFVASITEALSLGREPRIKAGRPAPDQPQAPDDPAFHAARLRLVDEPGGAHLWLNVDRDNLTIVDEPPPDAILTVLGLGIEIRVSEGLTQLILDHDRRHEVGFEGLVRGVRPDAGTFLLVHGDREIPVRVADGTRMWFDEDPIESLTPVAEALEAGLVVWAVGEGVIREDGDVILAVVVRFKTRNADHPVRFGGRVREIDVERGVVALVEGPLVKVGPDTRLAVNGEPVESLERVAAALEAGHVVHAFGEGVLDATANAPVILAAFIRFEVGMPPTAGQVEFAGKVGAVNVDAGTFTLVNGPTVQVTNETRFGDRSALTSLGAAAEALARGAALYAGGVGRVVSTEPRVIAAAVVVFTIED
jgi:hypothetical protein